MYGEGMANTFKRLQEEINTRETCTKDLRLTDPRDDKNCIEETKGGLLDEPPLGPSDEERLLAWRKEKRY
jgi:hypothetical protein